MLGLLLALAGGAYLASRGIVRIGESPTVGSHPVYLYDVLLNLREAGDPRSPNAPGRGWEQTETIGPKLIDASALGRLTLFEDWEWNPAESDTSRYAARYLYDPRLGQWKLLKTRTNYA